MIKLSKKKMHALLAALSDVIEETLEEELEDFDEDEVDELHDALHNAIELTLTNDARGAVELLAKHEHCVICQNEGAHDTTRPHVMEGQE